jgi:chemotaxis protein CheZ
MTEQAASKVLNATDIAKPIQDKLQSGAEPARPLGPPLRQPAQPGRVPCPGRRDPRVPGRWSSTTRETNAQLLEIMMAQDFQDLTGQVIKKVVDLAQGLEQQLLQVLIEAMPAERKAEASEP